MRKPTVKEATSAAVVALAASVSSHSLSNNQYGGESPNTSFTSSNRFNTNSNTGKRKLDIPLEDDNANDNDKDNDNDNGDKKRQRTGDYGKSNCNKNKGEKKLDVIIEEEPSEFENNTNPQHRHQRNLLPTQEVATPTYYSPYRQSPFAPRFNRENYTDLTSKLTSNSGEACEFVPRPRSPPINASPSMNNTKSNLDEPKCDQSNTNREIPSIITNLSTAMDALQDTDNGNNNDNENNGKIHHVDRITNLKKMNDTRNNEYKNNNEPNNTNVSTKNQLKNKKRRNNEKQKKEKVRQWYDDPDVTTHTKGSKRKGTKVVDNTTNPISATKIDGNWDAGNGLSSLSRRNTKYIEQKRVEAEASKLAAQQHIKEKEEIDRLAAEAESKRQLTLTELSLSASTTSTDATSRLSINSQPNLLPPDSGLVATGATMMEKKKEQETIMDGEKKSSLESTGLIEESSAMPPNTDTNDTNNNNAVIHTAHPAGEVSSEHGQQFEGGETILDNSNDNDISYNNYDEAVTEDRDMGHETPPPEMMPLITTNVGINSIVETSSQLTSTLFTATPTPAPPVCRSGNTHGGLTITTTANQVRKEGKEDSTGSSTIPNNSSHLHPSVIDYLKNWLRNNINKSLPDSEEKDLIVAATEMERTTLNKWLINTRRMKREVIERKFVMKAKDLTLPYFSSDIIELMQKVSIPIIDDYADEINTSGTTTDNTNIHNQNNDTDELQQQHQDDNEIPTGDAGEDDTETPIGISFNNHSDVLDQSQSLASPSQTPTGDGDDSRTKQVGTPVNNNKALPPTREKYDGDNNMINNTEINTGKPNNDCSRNKENLLGADITSGLMNSSNKPTLSDCTNTRHSGDLITRSPACLLQQQQRQRQQQQLSDDNNNNNNNNNSNNIKTNNESRSGNTRGGKKKLSKSKKRKLRMKRTNRIMSEYNSTATVDPNLVNEASNVATMNSSTRSDAMSNLDCANGRASVHGSTSNDEDEFGRTVDDFGENQLEEDQADAKPAAIVTTRNASATDHVSMRTHPAELCTTFVPNNSYNNNLAPSTNNSNQQQQPAQSISNRSSVDTGDTNPDHSPSSENNTNSDNDNTNQDQESTVEQNPVDRPHGNVESNVDVRDLFMHICKLLMNSKSFGTFAVLRRMNFLSEMHDYNEIAQAFGILTGSMGYEMNDNPDEEALQRIMEFFKKNHVVDARGIVDMIFKVVNNTSVRRNVDTIEPLSEFLFSHLTRQYQVVGDLTAQANNSHSFNNLIYAPRKDVQAIYTLNKYTVYDDLDYVAEIILLSTHDGVFAGIKKHNNEYRITINSIEKDISWAELVNFYQQYDCDILIAKLKIIKKADVPQRGGFVGVRLEKEKIMFGGAPKDPDMYTCVPDAWTRLCRYQKITGHDGEEYSYAEAREKITPCDADGNRELNDMFVLMKKHGMEAVDLKLGGSNQQFFTYTEGLCYLFIVGFWCKADKNNFAKTKRNRHVALFFPKTMLVIDGHPPMKLEEGDRNNQKEIQAMMKAKWGEENTYTIGKVYEIKTL